MNRVNKNNKCQSIFLHEVPRQRLESMRQGLKPVRRIRTPCNVPLLPLCVHQTYPGYVSQTTQCR